MTILLTIFLLIHSKEIKKYHIKNVTICDDADIKLRNNCFTKKRLSGISNILWQRDDGNVATFV